MPGISNIENIEVYRLPSGSRQLDLVGNITAKCAVQKTHAKKGQKKMKTEPTRTTQIIDAKHLKKPTKSSAPIPLRSTQLSSPSTTAATLTAAATLSTATVSSSSLPSSSSVTTSAPSTTATAPTVAAAAANVVPLKTRVVQLLALHPREEKELAKALRERPEDLQSILPIVANLISGRYVLKAETYKEVKIFDWGKYSAKEREIVVKNASTAFDKLGLGPDAPERDIFLAEKTKRASPPLVAEGYHVVGNMDSTSTKRWTGGGGSESEGLDKSSLLKPGATKKGGGGSSGGGGAGNGKKLQGLPLSGKKIVGGGAGSSTKGPIKVKGAEKAVAASLGVPNHSKGATTPTNAVKSAVGGTPNIGVGSPTVTGRRSSINGSSSNSNINGNGN
ncbi:hypothetical protein BGZ65_010216, partial [Modicella reniformis]